MTGIIHTSQASQRRQNVTRELRAVRDRNCQLCPLHKLASRVCVPGAGLYKLPAFVVGEAPGRQEDRRCRPFVGPSGSLLRKELQRAGIRPTQVYLTNTVKCWPQGAPKPPQVQTCSLTYLRRELEIAQPKWILAVGGIALRALTGEKVLSDVRGQILDCLLSDAFVIATYHPAYLMRDNRKMPQFRLDIDNFATLLRLEV